MVKKKRWRKGRGKLGVLDPLLGDWQTDADSPQRPVHCVRSRCERSFKRVLAGGRVALEKGLEPVRVASLSGRGWRADLDS